MFSVKIFNNKEKRNKEFDKSIKNIVSYIFEKLHYDNTRVISDDSCIEIISGKEESINSDEVIVELLIRKNIVINNSDFKDKAELDRHLTKIRHFCDQAKSIEELQYIPLNMRNG